MAAGATRARARTAVGQHHTGFVSRANTRHSTVHEVEPRSNPVDSDPLRAATSTVTVNWMTAACLAEPGNDACQHKKQQSCSSAFTRAPPRRTVPDGDRAAPPLRNVYVCVRARLASRCALHWRRLSKKLHVVCVFCKPRTHKTKAPHYRTVFAASPSRPSRPRVDGKPRGRFVAAWVDAAKYIASDAGVVKPLHRDAAAASNANNKHTRRRRPGPSSQPPALEAKHNQAPTCLSQTWKIWVQSAMQRLVQTDPMRRATLRRCKCSGGRSHI